MSGLKLSRDVTHEVVCILKDMSHLVVRIHVSRISLNRPEVTTSGIPYVFADKRGQWVGAAGSGRVRGVYATKGGHWDGCPLTGQSGDATGVVNSAHRQGSCWLIEIQTVRHVVFDSFEAENCKVVFWDEHVDGSGAVVDGEKVEVVTEAGGRVGRACTEEDSCYLYVYTHNEALVGRIKALCGKWRTMKERLVELVNLKGDKADDFDKATNDLHKTNLDTSDTKLMQRNVSKVVVIAHGHGKTKQITFGDLINKGGTHEETLEHSSATCAGSSGGLIFPIIDKHEDRLRRKDYHSYSHSGAKVNGSGISADWSTSC